MIEIDGTVGGGQLLRTALSLSAVTETPFRMTNVRGSRPNPGLKPQHVTAVDIVATICAADVAGARLDSSTLTFRPGTVRFDPMAVDIGTAGSITLLFDTVLPIAMAADEPFRMTAGGGTDVKWAPTVAYFRRVKLPLLTRCGLDADGDCTKTGFYPAGGGEAILRTTPGALSPLEIERRGELDRVEIRSKAATELADRMVAERQAERARKRLADAGCAPEIRRVEYVSTRSLGSSLLLSAVYDRSLAGFDSVGERGRTSEEVADDAFRRFEEFHAGGAPVDEYMADQVMTVLALVGGTVRIPTVTAHVRTNLAVIEKFGSDMSLTRRDDGTILLEASPHPAVRT
ncbi:RNA 3'-terminal-phosphate cyclase [Haladaptatus paucihalophilus DX253]|uniref:RNA 3'-terminal phosphate cyclase n=1 Tax=Haladaptatus paucihalophilus DX253 TaxID=797209 RepID=E7QVP8_HALPU|nr:RNA 3'-terminal phosphate cyclase [Haladaptatus paucihalophilus]EFW91311.1 RNA 3'-terminal-phosphate cyclase [Haladaptatus paucihalophilus DX253]SHL10443.1 RNA 3'-terminal phosphate cyclase (ATP) [Haladaptatus paucihalophilus DX253]